MRNPERIKDFLTVLKNYDGKILTNSIILEIVKELIKSGFYETVYMKKNSNIKNKLTMVETLTEEELEQIIKNSPQEHKEAGFDKGWPSRFDTWYRLAKELGFVYYEFGKPIEFSKTGLMLVDIKHPEFEQQVFLNAFVKYQRNNPFKRVLNENAPLILLLQVIKKLNEDKRYNGKGITLKEVPIVLCWKDNDSEALYTQIVKIREEYRYNPSGEVILDVCDKQTGGRHSSNKDKTILQEYPDEFLRKMRLTGLITIRGFGKFIDLNSKEINKTNYAIEKYSNYKKFSTERKYFEYMSSIDAELISPEIERPINIEIERKLLVKWAEHYKWGKIKEELITLSTNKSSKDLTLRLIPGPLRLEFLVTLAIVVKYPKVNVKPNYISDDEGLPSSHAPGGKPDIECEELRKYILVEVTLLTGTAQTIREMPAIARHLKEKIQQKNRAISLFISPIVYEDSVLFSEFIKHTYKRKIFPVSIPEFVSNLEKTKKLYIE